VETWKQCLRQVLEALCHSGFMVSMLETFLINSRSGVSLHFPVFPTECLLYSKRWYFSVTGKVKCQCLVLCTNYFSSNLKMHLQKEVLWIMRISDSDCDSDALPSSLIPFSPSWLMSHSQIWILLQWGGVWR